MKVNYFGYYIIKEPTGEKYLTSISGLLKSFCKYDNSELKNKFSYEDENLYLLHHVGDTFLFMQTRNNELIKKINTQNISLGEIHSLLSENEKIGFASYVLLKDDYFGYGSTLLAPKVDVFIGYINELLRRIGQADLRQAETVRYKHVHAYDHRTLHRRCAFIGAVPYSSSLPGIAFC